MLENNDFPDTDGIVDAATVEGKEADVREELDEGNKSNENNLNDLFINIVNFQFELAT